MPTSSPLDILLRTDALTLVAFPVTHLAVLRPSAPTTAAQALASPLDVVAVVDGPMGSFCPGTVQNYARATCGDVDTLLYDSLTGANDPGRRPEDGLTFALRDGQVYAVHGEHYPQGADLVVQTYPSLVEDGRNVASTTHDTNRDHRAAIGILHDGRAFLAVGVGSMRAFAQALLDAGASWAGYTDGGGSTALGLRGGERLGSSENRRVFSWVAVLARPRPAPGVNLWAVLGVAGVALGVLALVKRVWKR